MAAQYITKTHKNKQKEEVSITYRIDADFVPSEINEISYEFIENYCVAKKQLEWLIETVNITTYDVKRKNKETNKYEIVTVTNNNYPFIMLRNDFAKKFFPQILKGLNAKPNETFKQRIMRLYGEK